MKQFFILLSLAGAGIFGYVAEPSLRFQLTGMSPAAKGSRNIRELPHGTSPINLANLTPEQLPVRVLINADVKVTDSSSGVTMVIPAGNRVKLISIDGENALVSPGEGTARGTVPVLDTDLIQQLIENPPAPSAPSTPPAIPTGGESEEPTIAPAPPPTPEAAPSPPPAPVAEPVAPPAAPPEVEPAPSVPAEPAPTPAPPAAAATSDVVKVMKESIQAKQVTEFTFEQVLEWLAGTDEIVDGETYQTGIASYKAETIFGVKTIQAKALIKGGKVQRWIWPKSGMDIK